MRPETEPWWKQAQADFDTAELTLGGQQFYAVSWFAQQAAEKALKALYLERHGRLAPRTHDLRFLGNLLAVPTTVDTDLDSLTSAFGLARYPDALGVAPVDAVGKGEAIDHLDTARRVLQWISNEL